MSLVPWSLGRPLVWDATCPDTFATSYRGLATSGAGYAMAVRQHEWKHCMCTSNKKIHDFGCTVGLVKNERKQDL